MSSITKKIGLSAIIKILINKTKYMSNENCGNCCSKKMGCGKSSNGVYFLGFIGAAVYYFSTATGFWVGVIGLLKAMLWPGFLVFEILKFLGV